MESEVDCRRCGARRPGLAAAPLPGRVGAAVLAAVCAECWTAWLGQQVIVMNENRLSPGDPEHYARLVAAMREYLRLEAGPA